MKVIYCSHCGAKLETRQQEGRNFDSYTGKKEVKTVWSCPNKAKLFGLIPTPFNWPHTQLYHSSLWTGAD